MLGKRRERVAEGGPGVRVRRRVRRAASGERLTVAAEPLGCSAFLGIPEQAPALPPLGYVLALELLRSAFPFPVAAAYLGTLRQSEPDPRALREAVAALELLGFRQGGELTAEGKRAAWEALRSLSWREPASI